MSLAPDLAAAAPELFLACAAIALLMLGVFRGDGAGRPIMRLSVLALIVALLLVVFPMGGEGIFFNSLFIKDVFGNFMKGLVLVGSGLTILMGWRYVERERMDRPELPVLLLFATVGMLLMISANDLISLYVGLELQSLALYVAAAIRRDSLRASEAGLKYFVLGALSSGMLLYGLSLVYGFAGTTGFTDLAAAFARDAAAGTPVSLGLIVGLVFVAAGIAFKISAVPFHMWTPDVYEGAPTAITAFFAVAPKVAAMALFVRVLMGPFGDLVGQWQQIVVFISIASMALGAFAAIAQSNVKRLMAYSSIGNVGYALVGLASGTEAGIRGVTIYMAIYLVMTVGTFACILAMRINERGVESIDDLRGLSKTHPMMAAALAIFMFSLAGIPPLAGFFGKLYVFLAAIQAGLYGLAVIGVLTSVVGAYYYLRIVKLMYFDEPTEVLDRPIGREVGLVMGVSALAILLFFVMPSLVVDGASAAALSLFAG
ncbi:NADH dehydrogenase subunit N [Tistlia consotensis]|uniref:NADH-quinone oxidoreductase subunit N n=1 Tax=Tistlia consotensis USBA 355 TaxID=560819 RepID=A0A1Y6BXP7_9PROT|nr:NADH-quinone oxidoreductase subunit NuoN [Tistlia consotensis]SMF25159.1 NADH dehydrogenase subunit N [Tistlia consotensis USBA 355]SNR59933.1 NADH dehydrogenase subunit N [Tistlia consotensis]